MPIAKIRNLDKYGIITDVDPYDLPPEAFSFGNNVRFRNGRVSRSPVFRTSRLLGTTDPRFVYATNPTTGTDLTFVGYLNGRVFLTTALAETDYSIAGYVNANAEAVWTATHLADVTYINRADRVPWSLTSAGSQFSALAGGWDATWRAGLIKSCGGALVALNITKGATNYPSMVKTSSFPTSGAIPSSWDQTVPATNATENILAELEGPIVDACGYGNDLIIYGHNQSWLMQKVNAFEIFDYFKLPFQKGAINANCSVEVDGKHFVFGPDDIWIHDGTTEKSICEGRTREFIYNSLNAAKASKCFVAHNPLLKDIAFCFVSGDRGTSFVSSNVGGCNRQAVYNYANDTWTFDDLPSVYSSSYANLNVALTYATVAATYATMGGSYQDQEDAFKRTPVYVGDVNATYSLATTLYAFDLYGIGSTVSFPVDTNASKGIHLERDGIDLDQIPNVELPDYKLIKCIYPLARLDTAASADLIIQFGSADYYGADAIFDGPSMSYDSPNHTQYKLDYNMAGRYLAMKLDFADYKTISLSGFDVDIDVNGQR